MSQFVRGGIELLNQSAAGFGNDPVCLCDLENHTVEVSGIGGGDTIDLYGSNNAPNDPPGTGAMQAIGSTISADGIYAISPSLPVWLAAKKTGTNGVVLVQVGGKSF